MQNPMPVALLESCGAPNDAAFQGRRPATAEVRLTDGVIADIDGSVRIIALSEKGALTLVLEAGRAASSEGRALVSAIQRAESDLDRGTPGPSSLEADTLEVGTLEVGTLEVGGAWRSRSWKDAAGEKQIAWDFHVATWRNGVVARGRPLKGGRVPVPAI